MSNRSLRARVAAALCITALIALVAVLSTGSPAAPRTAATTRAAAALPAPARVPARRQAARERLAAALGRGATVQSDRATGGVRMLAKLGGTLTGAHRGSDPRDVVLRYVRTHRRVFGDLGALRLTQRRHDGRLTVLRFAQEVDGVRFIDGELRAVLDGAGRILQIDGGARSRIDRTLVRPTITKAQAVARAGGEPPAPGTPGPRLVLTAHDGAVRAAWRVVHPDAEHVWDDLIDARTGARLRRTDRVRHVTASAYDAWPGAPGAAGTQRDVPIGAWLDAGAQELTGPRVRAYADLDDDDTEDDGEQTAPQPDGNYTYARPTTVYPGVCPAAGCSWYPGFPNSWSTGRRQATTQLFVTAQRFADHLASAPISFDAFGAADQLQAQALDGAAIAGGLPDGDHLNNANMYTQPEGFKPRMQMYLWAGDPQNGIPAVHAADDPSVVDHEYAHGLVERLVTDPTGWGAADLRQSGALNEALADVYALDGLIRMGVMTDGGADGDLRVAPFADPAGTIRAEPIDCPVGSAAATCAGAGPAGAGGYTYGDFGKVNPAGVAEVHSDGEILAQALWSLRARLGADYGDATGAIVFESLLTRALRDFTPAQPTYLDLRNALLQADHAASGASAAAIWDVFKERGMGFYAASIDGDDTHPVEDFSAPPATGGATVHGTVRDRVTQAPVPGVVVRLTGHEDYARQGDALTGLVATTDADGRFSISGVPAGTYPEPLLSGPGYERLVAPALTVGADGAQLDETLRRNWADTRAGATVTFATGDDRSGEGCGAGAAFDGVSRSGWLTADGAGDDFVEVRLPQEVRLTSVAIDARPGCGVDPAQAVAANVEVEASGAGILWDHVVGYTPGRGSVGRLTEIRPLEPVEGVRSIRVKLTARDGAAAVGVGEVQVFAIPKAPPRAQIAATPELPDTGELVTLDASRSNPGSAAVTQVRWDLDGDGEFEHDTGTTLTAGHRFTEAGRHTVGVEIVNGDRERDTARRTIWIGRSAEISDLGALDGDTQSRAIYPTERGVIAGESAQDVAAPHAARYRDGAWERLPGLFSGPATFDVAYQANDAGQAAGVSTSDRYGDEHAVRWDGTTPTDLGSFGGPSAEAVTINAAGTVGGYAETARDHARAFIKPVDGPLLDVQELAGIPADQRRDSIVKKLSDHGSAVGCLDYDDTDGTCKGKPFLYSGGSLTELPAPGDGSGAALDVNEHDAVAGAVHGPNGLQPATWTAGALTVLPDLGGTDGQAIAINDAGLIVGEAHDLAGAEHAVLWRDGALQRLDDIVADPAWTLQTAEGVNERGEITGAGLIGGVRHGYMLNVGPCRVCVQQVAFEQRDQPSGTWVPVGPTGTVDGNLVHARIQVKNTDDVAHVFQLRLVDENRGAALPDSGTTVSLAAGEEQWITADWDTSGLAWDKGVADADHVLRVQARLGHTSYHSKRAILKVRPKPMVLVHGMLSNAATWSGYAAFADHANPDWGAYAVGDGKADGTMDTGSYADLGARPNTIAQNAKVLAHYIDGVREQEDAEHVDLVAHSMGGLISRLYINDLMPAAVDGKPLASHLVQLGTPNMGSPCADELTTWQTFELRTDVAAAFNSRVLDRKGVPFSVYVGDYAPFTCGDPGSAGDGVVPTWSAKWQIADTRTAPTRHDDMTADASIFTSWVKGHLTGLLGGGEQQAALTRAAVRVAGPAGTGVEPQARTLLADRRVAVPAATVVDLPLAVDGGDALDVTVLARGDVGADLIAPDGAVADHTTGAGLFRVLRAQTPATGSWTLRLHGAAEATQAQVTARVQGDAWSLNLLVGDRTSAGVPVLATIGRGEHRLGAATVSVTFERPQGGASQFLLSDDGAHGDGAAGDGCYGATADLPAGAAQLVTMTATAADGASRLRRTTADVADGAVAGAVVPACPRSSGRPGELVYEALTDAGLAHRTLDPASGLAGALAWLDERGAQPSYSPDGARMVYVAKDEYSLHVADADGGNDQALTQADGVPRWGARFSADGARLAYVRGCYGIDAQCRIVVRDIASGAEQEVPLPTGFAAGAPEWAPDGERLSLTATVDAPCAGRPNCPYPTDVFTVRVDGSDLRRITTDARTFGGGWSPDGRYVVATRVVSLDRELDIRDVTVDLVRTDGTGRRQLLASSREDETSPPNVPVWSPDGARIAVVAQLGQGEQAYSLLPDGSDVRRLTSDTQRKFRLTWRPRPFTLEPRPPVCQDITTQTTPGTAIRIPVPCSDANGDPLSLRVVSPPAHGTAGTPDASGAVRYAPADGFEGTDGFDVEASDGSSDARAHVTVVVKAPATEPPPASAPPATVPPPPSGPVTSGRTPPATTPEPGGVKVVIPGTCVTDPRTGICIVPVGCPPGSENCTASVRQTAGRPRGVRAVAARATTYVRATRVTVAAGATRDVKLRLTTAGRRALARRGRLVVPVRLEVRRGGHVLKQTTRRVVFKVRRRGAPGRP